MRLLLVAAGIGLLFATVLPSNTATASCSARTKITGAWESHDGGTYFVRRVENNVIWMVGQSSDGGRQWLNVYRGVINGDTITGEWMDVRAAGGFQPEAHKGRLTLKLVGTLDALHGFNKVSDTGGFGGRRWFACR